jgi:hypothetical protein
MTKDQKDLILSLLSDSMTRQKQLLKCLQQHDDNFVKEMIYQQKINLIEETFKVVNNDYNCN